MKLPHPGCGCSTQFVAKLLAVSDLVFGLIGIFWFVYILDGYGLLMEDPSIYNINKYTTTPTTVHSIGNSSKISSLATTPHPHDYTYQNVGDTHSTNHSLISVTDDGIQIHGKAANIAISAFYTVVNLFAFVLLLSAAHDKNILKLRIWFGIRLGIFVFKLLLYSMYIVVGAPVFSQLPHMLFMAIHLYGLWLVSVFIKEIQEERRQSALPTLENHTPHEKEKRDKV